jgi:hypothetical protein
MAPGSRSVARFTLHHSQRRSSQQNERARVGRGGAFRFVAGPHARRPPERNSLARDLFVPLVIFPAAQALPGRLIEPDRWSA